MKTKWMVNVQKQCYLENAEQINAEEFDTFGLLLCINKHHFLHSTCLFETIFGIAGF